MTSARTYFAQGREPHSVRVGKMLIGEPFAAERKEGFRRRGSDAFVANPF